MKKKCTLCGKKLIVPSWKRCQECDRKLAYRPRSRPSVQQRTRRVKEFGAFYLDDRITPQKIMNAHTWVMDGNIIIGYK